MFDHTHTHQYRCVCCVWAESLLFDECGGWDGNGGGGGGCCDNDDDGGIISMGTPVYGDFTTSSYFGGKSLAARFLK